jgi:Tfp pilus assembly protein PilF
VSQANQQIKKLEEAIQSLMSREHWQEAADLLTENSPSVERDWKLSWNLGWCYFKLGRFREAQTKMEHSAGIAPPNRMHNCKFGLGMTLLMKGQNAKASVLLNQFLRLKEFYAARLALALAYMKLGRLKEAEQIHLQGLKLKPHSSERHKGYADFLSDVGRETEAQRMHRVADRLKRIN